MPIGSSIRFSPTGSFLQSRKENSPPRRLPAFCLRILGPTAIPSPSTKRFVIREMISPRISSTCLWEYPLAFQRMVGYKHREAIIDIFAGRIYGEIGASNPAGIAMRKLLAPKNEVNQEM